MSNDKAKKYAWARNGKLHHKGQRIEHKEQEELTAEELEILKPQLDSMARAGNIYDTVKRAKLVRTKKEEEEIRKRIKAGKGGK